MQLRNRTLKRRGAVLSAAVMALSLLAPSAGGQEDYRFEAFGGVTPLGQSVYLPLEFAGGFVWTNCDVNNFSSVGIASLYYTGWGVETVMTTTGIPGAPRQVPFTALATNSGEHEDSWAIPSFESPDGAPMNATAVKGYVKADATPTCQATSRLAEVTLQDVVEVAEGQSRSFVKRDGATVIDSHSGSLAGIDIGNGALKIDRMAISSVSTVSGGTPKLEQSVTYQGVTVNGQGAAITEEGLVLAEQPVASGDDLRDNAKPLEQIELSDGLTIKVRTLPDVRRVDPENKIASGVIQGVEIVLNWPPAEGAPLANTARGLAFRLGFAASHVQQFTVGGGEDAGSVIGDDAGPGKDGSDAGPALPATSPVPRLATPPSPPSSPAAPASAPATAPAGAPAALPTRLIADESPDEGGSVADRMETTYLLMVLAVAALLSARLVLPQIRRIRGER